MAKMTAEKATQPKVEMAPKEEAPARVEMAPSAEAQEAKERTQRAEDLATIASTVAQVQDARDAENRNVYKQYSKGFKPTTEGMLLNDEGDIAQPDNFNLKDHCAQLAINLGHEVFPWKRVKPAAHIDLENAPEMWNTRSTNDVRGWCKWSRPGKRAREHGFNYMKASWGGELFKPVARAKPNAKGPGGADRGYSLPTNAD